MSGHENRSRFESVVGAALTGFQACMRAATKRVEQHVAKHSTIGFSVRPSVEVRVYN